MGCFVLTNTYLKMIKEKKQQIDYEFAYQYRKEKETYKQFLIFDLNQYINERNIQLDQRLKNKTFFIAGLFNDCQKNVSVNAKEYLKQQINNNIYFQQGQFECGFQNIIDSLKSYLLSCEVQKKYIFENPYDKEYLEEDIITVNLMMYFGGVIYLSKSFSPNQIIKNKYFAKLKNQKKFRELNQNDLSEVESNMLLLNANISNNLEEIMLTSTLCLDQFLFENFEKFYPHHYSVGVFSDMYYLKIKNISSLKNIMNSNQK